MGGTGLVSGNLKSAGFPQRSVVADEPGPRGQGHAFGAVRRGGFGGSDSRG